MLKIYAAIIETQAIPKWYELGCTVKAVIGSRITAFVSVLMDGMSSSSKPAVTLVSAMLASRNETFRSYPQKGSSFLSEYAPLPACPKASRSYRTGKIFFGPSHGLERVVCGCYSTLGGTTSLWVGQGIEKTAHKTRAVSGFLIVSDFGNRLIRPREGPSGNQGQGSADHGQTRQTHQRYRTLRY